jgi:hypothetical protein
MIAVKLQGGLGNQLFQYALGLVLAKKAGTRIFVEISSIESDPKRTYELGALARPPGVMALDEIRARIKAPATGIRGFIQRVRKPQLRYITERDAGFCPEILTAGWNIYLDGYWQSARYFTGFEDFIRKHIRFSTNSEYSERLLRDIQQTGGAISVHVRRGDYVAEERTNAVHGVLGLDYYERAFQEMNVSPEQVFLFTDDADWARAQPLFRGARLVSGRGLNAREELMLMAAAQRHIIANSSFSWWGAWLSGSTSVIAPKHWFADPSFERADRVPEHWIRL